MTVSLDLGGAPGFKPPGRVQPHVLPSRGSDVGTHEYSVKGAGRPRIFSKLSDDPGFPRSGRCVIYAGVLFERTGFNQVWNKERALGFSLLTAPTKAK